MVSFSNKFYATVICLMFNVFGLCSAVGYLNYGHVALLSFFLYEIANSLLNSSLLMDRRYVPIIFYTLAQTIFLLLMRTHFDGSLLIKVLQWLSYISIIALFNRSYFDSVTMIKMLRVTILLTCSYLIIQQALSTFFRIYLPPGIPFLPYTRDGLEHAYRNLDKYNLIFRPRSFFSEPAAFCQFALSALVIELFYNMGKDKNDRDMRFVVLLVSSIILSKSGTGFFGILFIFSLFYFKILAKQKKNIKYFINEFLVVFVIFPIIASILINYTTFGKVATRFFSSGNFIENLLLQDRFIALYRDGISSTLKMSGLIELLWGKGFSVDNLALNANSDLYLGGFIRHYYCFGLIGCVILCYLLYRLYKIGSTTQRMLILTFSFMCIGSNPLHNQDLLIPLAFASSSSFREEDMENYKKKCVLLHN